MRKSQQEIQNVKTHNRTTQQLKRWATRTDQNTYLEMYNVFLLIAN